MEKARGSYRSCISSSLLLDTKEIFIFSRGASDWNMELLALQEIDKTEFVCGLHKLLHQGVTRIRKIRLRPFFFKFSKSLFTLPLDLIWKQRLDS
jgi:hypothetical protein